MSRYHVGRLFLETIYFLIFTSRFLQDQSFFAVAQKKYVFIYDRDGVEIHCLKAHIEPTRLEFLPYHWLLATIVCISNFSLVQFHTLSLFSG
jgi:hypothetical protein